MGAGRSNQSYLLCTKCKICIPQIELYKENDTLKISMKCVCSNENHILSLNQYCRTMQNINQNIAYCTTGECIGNNSNARSYCLNCQVFICNQCKSLHDSILPNRNHVQATQEVILNCDKHPGKKQKNLCHNGNWFDCKQCTCEDRTENYDLIRNYIYLFNKDRLIRRIRDQPNNNGSLFFCLLVFNTINLIKKIPNSSLIKAIKQVYDDNSGTFKLELNSYPTRNELNTYPD